MGIKVMGQRLELYEQSHITYTLNFMGFDSELIIHIEKHGWRKLVNGCL
jgi:hypothetical protein